MNGRQLFAVALFGLAAALAANALLGPLLLDVVEYPFSESVRNQAIGLEAVTLLLVVPWAMIAGALVAKGHRHGPVLAIPPGGYAAYMMVQYVVGPNYVEHAFVVPLHLAIFVLGMTCATAGWALQDAGALRPARSRWYGWLALGLGTFVFARYFPLFFGGVAQEPLPEEFAQDPAMYWTVVLLDVGIVVPACVAVAVAVWNRSPMAAKAVAGLLGWFVLVPISVAAMAVVMLVNDDPHKSLPTAVLLGIAAAVFTGFAGWVGTRLMRSG